MTLPTNTQKLIDTSTKARINYLCSKLPENTQLALSGIAKQFWSAGFALPSTPDNVCEFLLNKFDEGVKQSTLRNYLARLVKIHRHAMYPELADAISSRASAMLRGLTLEKIEQGERETRESAYPLALIDALRIDTYLVRKIESAAGRHIGMAYQDLALFRLLWWSGCRESEIVSLKRWQIKLCGTSGEAGIELTWTKTKRHRDITGTGTARFIPALPKSDPLTCLIEYIALYWPHFHGETPEETYLFIRQQRNGQWKKSHMHPNSIPAWLRSIAKKAGVAYADQLSGHSCRHGLATMMSSHLELRELMDYFRWVRAESALKYLTNKGASQNIATVLSTAASKSIKST